MAHKVPDCWLCVGKNKSGSGKGIIKVNNGTSIIIGHFGIPRHHIHIVIWDCLLINLILIPQFIICYSRLAGSGAGLTQASNMLQHIIKLQTISRVTMTLFILHWISYWQDVTEGSGLRILPKTIITSDRSSKLEINKESKERSSRSPSVWPCRWSSPPRRCQGGPCDKRSTIARCPDPRDMSIIKKIVKHTMISPCCCDSEGRPPRNHSTCGCTSYPPPPPSGCRSTRPHGAWPLGWHVITQSHKAIKLINILHRLCHFDLKCKTLNRYNEDMKNVENILQIAAVTFLIIFWKTFSQTLRSRICAN